MAAALPLPAAAAAPVAGGGSLLISELQTGGLAPSGQEQPQQEFIELYNAGNQAVPLDGIRLEYLSATHSGEGEPTRVLAVFQGSLAAGHFYLVSSPDYLDYADTAFAPSTNGLLARSGGHIRLVAGDGTIVDMLSWGSANAPGQWWKAPVIAAGLSVQRVLPGDPDYTDGRDFRPPDTHVSPTSGLQIPSPEPDPDPTLCSGIILSEVLPNAAGADAGKEFIEVHNPTDHSVPLAGCALQAGNKTFALPPDTLAAGAYRAFYDNETNITLPNATAQTITLQSPTDEQQVTYADNMDDDSSWILLGGAWQATTAPTPGAANILLVKDTQPAAPKPAAAAADCGPGKERNPQTIPVQASQTACKPGQARNPATNRCRSIATASAASLTPCKPGQQRNPETNRCRAVAAAATAAKPCAAGQERNPATNRCRKAAASSAASMAKVQDVITSPIAGNYRWWIAGFVVLAAAGYAGYEWRRDIGNALAAFKARLAKPK